MKWLHFLSHKIIIVETMLIILCLAEQIFQVSIPGFNFIIDTSLHYLTPIAIVAFGIYIVTSLLSNKIIEIALGIVLGGLILYYLFNYIL